MRLDIGATCARKIHTESGVSTFESAVVEMVERPVDRWLDGRFFSTTHYELQLANELEKVKERTPDGFR